MSSSRVSPPVSSRPSSTNCVAFILRSLPRAGEIIPEVEGTRPWGPPGKGSPSVSKGPKPPIQLLQLLKNSPREAKRAHFRYILGPPGSHPGTEFMGPGGEGPSRSPGFSGLVFAYLYLGRSRFCLMYLWGRVKMFRTYVFISIELHDRGNLFMRCQFTYTITIKFTQTQEIY